MTSVPQLGWTTPTARTVDVPPLPWSGPLTYDDLEALRDAAGDGHRYELVDGLLVMSPSPVPLHQRAVGNAYVLLRAACPADLEVFFAPLDVVLADADGVLSSALVPDLLVARSSDIGERYLPTAPLLAVEVLSPITRSYDLHLKKDRYRRGGFSHYWVVDPVVPAITAWHLVGDGDAAAYELVSHVEGDEELVASAPLAVRMTPRSLVER